VRQGLFLPCLFLFLVILGEPVSADTRVLVEVYEGTAVRMDGSSRIELASGDLLPLDARIRLEEDGVLEFFDGDARVRIHKRGVYRIEDLFAFHEKLADIEVRQLLIGRLRSAVYAFYDQVIRDLPRMAHDAADADNPERDPVITALIEDGFRLLLDGRYVESYHVFQEISERYLAPERGGTDDTETAYSKAERFLTHVEVFFSAVRHQDVHPGVQGDALDTDFPPVREAVLMYAFRLIEIFAFRESLEALEWYIREIQPDPEEMQCAFLLKALCFKGMGNIGTAAAYLREAVSYGADTPAGRAAVKTLGSL
jgi:hypothetical protein